MFPPNFIYQLYNYTDLMDFVFKRMIRWYFITLIFVFTAMILDVTHFSDLFATYVIIYQNVEMIDVHYNKTTDPVNILFFLVSDIIILGIYDFNDPVHLLFKLLILSNITEIFI